METIVLHIKTWWDATKLVLWGKCKVLDLFRKHERVKQIRPSKGTSWVKKNVTWVDSNSSYRKKLYAVVEKRSWLELGDLCSDANATVYC